MVNGRLTTDKRRPTHTPDHNEPILSQAHYIDQGPPLNRGDGSFNKEYSKHLSPSDRERVRIMNGTSLLD